LAKTLENSNLAENLADLDNEQEMVGNPKNEKASISKEEKQKKQQQIQEIKKLKALGRCYLVSSAGYTSYAFRDVAARIQWTRDLDAKTMITITGNEQIHHFQQVFAICEYLSNLKEFQDFFGNTVFENLKKENLVHIPYGFLTLSDGKMSSRSGNVLTIRDFFDQVQQTALENLVAKNQQKNQKEDNTLENEEEKFEISTKESNLENFENSKDLANTEGDLVWKSQKIALAALKWYDLNRSASENLVLNIPEILNFVGNTGVYQLYTFARIKNILKKCQADNSQILEIENNSLNNDFDSNFDGNSKKTNPENNDKINFTADFNLLNTEEKIILKKLYLTDFVLEKICQNFKPHLLCTHLYELCTLINAWYGNNSVSGETDPIRQQTLLVLCTKITIYLRESLNLLGIEVLDDL
jgi:arginyl-tRNA synthetase